MRLEDLVPPLELCKRIPAGAFAESEWVYLNILVDGEPVVEVRRYAIPETIGYPAPTLQEVMEALPACTCYRLGKTWTVALCNDVLDNGVKSRRAATAALRLWLEVEGVKDE